MDPAPAPAAIEFGRFSVLPHRRELLAEGRPVELGGRAFDVLMVLIEASGAVVSKNTLMERVWPDRIVEENSLQAQISALRKAFAGDRDLIRTIAGRGYQWRVERALSSLRPGVSGGTRREMQLYATLAGALYPTKGLIPEVCAAWTDVL